MFTTDEGSKLSKEGSVDIDNSDSDSICSSASGSPCSTSGSVSKISYCNERESNTEEFKDD